MDYLPNVYRGYRLFHGDLDAISTASQVTINTINQYSFCVAEEDAGFKKSLEEADILLPDGVGIVVALRATTGLKIKKISGADLHRQQLQKLNKNGGSCFYLGSSDSTLSKIRHRLQKEYPNISCCTYSPPFAKHFTDEDNSQMLNKINEFNPDVLFVGMTAPKQEKWVSQQKDKINAKVICSIGAVFDFYAGTVKRPSSFWINLGLEWFVRLCKEPKRMWKRYLYYGPIFVYILIKEMLFHEAGQAGSLNYQSNN